ncbi:MAG TPA: type II secretion system protein GspK [Candidatus Paceibacterota bacterium]|nr:type II secretion system protein GspK [Verrucomicrobiota bacterium]HSA12639.1 type II secretion system protein GspK [Candidatus Paceibacterota bacterium]
MRIAPIICWGDGALDAGFDPRAARCASSALPIPRYRFGPQAGIALVIVMISVTVLTILAAGFAYSMKVETKLARNSNCEAELEWLGRSGVEYARWVLGNSLLNPMQPYDSRDQPWATGYGLLGPTNNPIGEVQKTLTLGRGTITWSITDLESRFNINSPEPVLQQILPQALNLMGVAPGEATPIVNSIFDWIDRDDQTHPEGAEVRDYQAFDPPYLAKDGPIDDLAELLLIRGITPEIYYGLASTNYQPSYYSQQRNRFGRYSDAPPPIAVGLTNLFTPLSSGKVNINTASPEVLQLIPGVDNLIAEAIVSGRSGEDDGSGLMGPYRNVDQVRRVPNIPLEMVRQLQPFCDVRSKTFQVQVDAEVAGYKRTFFAILGRENQNRVQILSFYWK